MTTLFLSQLFSGYLSTLLANSTVIFGLGWLVQRQQKKQSAAIAEMQKQYMELLKKESEKNSAYFKMES